MTAARALVVGLAGWLAVAPTAAQATEEDIACWTSAAVDAEASQPFGAVRVEAYISGTGFDARMHILSVVLGGRQTPVPESALRDLQHPLLETLQVVSTVSAASVPQLVIRFRLGALQGGVAWEEPTVSFVFEDGRLVSRSITRRTAARGWEVLDERAL